jgi:tetratricopeptide (TPR) repeat protein
MDHPNIAKVLDAGTTGSEPRTSVTASVQPLTDVRGSGRPYFVMELVKGISITKYCDQEHLSPKERLELFIPVCQAVQHAHQKGIIHRDLKPSNVLIALYDGKPVPKIIDFGVAKATSQKLTEKTMFTEVGQIVGTVEYMAPEQAELNNLDIDTRADIYSLGVILYELLAGSPPFTSKQLRSAAFTEMLRMIREVEPPKPSTKLSSSKELPSIAAKRKLEPKRLCKLVYGDLDWIVMKALEKDRGRRYETANGFAMDIQRHLADEPVLASPPSVRYRLGKFVRKHRGPVLAASIIVVLLVGGIVGTAWGFARADRLRQLAEQREGEALDEKAKAEASQKQAMDALRATTDDVVEQLIGAKPMLGPAEKAFLENTLKRWQTFAMEQGQGEQARAIRAEGTYRVAELRRNLGQHENAIGGYQEAIDLFGKLAADFPAVPQYRQDLAKCHNNLGRLLAHLNKHAEAAEAYRQALAIREKLATESPAPEYRGNLARSLNNLGLLLADLGKRAEAEEAYRQALAIQERVVTESPAAPQYREQLAGTLNNLGLLLADLGKRGEAEEAYHEALTILEKLAIDFPAEPGYRMELAGIHIDLGSVLRNLGRRAEAVTAYRKAQAIQEKLAADFPAVPQYRRDLAISHSSLGLVQAELGIRPEAEQEYRLAQAIQEKLAADFPAVPVYRMELARTHNNRGTLFEDDPGKRPQAEEAYRQALAIQEKVAADFPAVPGYRVDLGGSQCNFGNLLRSTMRPERALEWYARAIATLDEALRLVPTDFTARQFKRNVYWGRARAYDNLNRHVDAVNDWERAIEVDEGLGRDWSARTRVAFGWALYEIGRLEEAVEEYRKALALDPNLASAHNNLGRCLYYLGRREEAVAEYHKAIALDTQFTAAHDNLGDALAGEGRLDEAAAEYGKAVERGSKYAAEHLRWLPMVRRLPAVLRGDDRPANAAEELDFAILCQQYYLRRYVAAERFFAGAFAADPKLVDDLKSWNRYNAACAAALAGSGQGENAAQLDDKEKARLRGQALVWLKADLAAHGRQLASDQLQDRDEARVRLLHWQQDPDLVGVRDAAGLAKLPVTERAAWQKLWQEVEGVLAKFAKK